GCNPFVWILVMDQLGGVNRSAGAWRARWRDARGGAMREVARCARWRDARGGDQRRRSRDDRMRWWMVAGSWSSKSSWVTRGRRGGVGMMGAGGSDRT